MLMNTFFAKGELAIYKKTNNFKNTMIFVGMTYYIEPSASNINQIINKYSNLQIQRQGLLKQEHDY